MTNIELIVKDIIERVNVIDYKEYKDRISLLDGIGGIPLLNYLYAKHIDEAYYDKLDESLNNLLDVFSTNNLNYTFCTGKSGLNWLFRYLNQENVLESDDADSFCSDDNLIKSYSVDAIINNDFDFLHGGIGGAYYLIYEQKDTDIDYLKKIFQVIYFDLVSEKNIYPHFDFEARCKNHNLVNLGFAHGLPSLIKFLYQLHKTNSNIEKVREVIFSLTEKLITYQNSDKNHSYFPNLYNLNLKTSDEYSRLGWCYGDLTIAYVIYNSGVLLKQQNFINFSLEIFKSSFKRKAYNETSVRDAGICHGSAGIVHIYNKMWHLTNDTEFRDAADFWINYTLNFYMQKSKLIRNFEKYNAITNQYEDEISLLEGEIGIALVLLTYLTNDFSWDYCLMLND